MKLTLEEKVQLLDGQDVWHTKPMEGLPSIMMADGPHGLRKQLASTDNLGVLGSVPATCFPTASLTACSFDRTLLASMGKHMAIEAKANQVQIILGPGINMKRSPLCGRNFEYFSEDPYLAGELGAAMVRAIEDEGVGTSVKHFFANNQERYRFTIDAIVDERALREIYLKAFERVVKENPATIMASYNKINRHYATEHPYLNQILRKEWGYYGVVVSDWGAINHRVDALKATTDLEMPSSFGYRANEILKQTQDDTTRQAINKSSERIIDMVRKYKRYDDVTFDINAHHKEAIRIARESMVLLKNQNVLPLKKKEKIAIIGGFIDDIRYQGAGSSHINPTKLEQIINVAKDYSENITFAKGYTLDNHKTDDALVKEATLCASEADKIIYLFGLPESEEAEGYDRKHLNIPQKQIDLLKELYTKNTEIIGVALGGSVMNLSFEKQYLKGLLLAYLGGQGAARAIFDILYGKENPSGRLAETWIDDIASCNVQLTDDNHAVYYDESIYIGYRYYQSYNQKPHYPFGYGLSYTQFEYGEAKLTEQSDHFQLDFSLKNIGTMKGKEVIQIYIQNNESSVYKARWELKAIDKVHLAPGESIQCHFEIPKSAFAHWDLYKKRWVIESGDYAIVIAKNAMEEIETIDVHVDGESIHHQSLSYQKYTYETIDFPKLIPFELPQKNIRHQRPFTLSSTLDDAKHTWMGRLVAKMVIRTATKETKNMSHDMIEIAKRTITETPLRMLVLFSSGKVSFEMGEGLVDLMNGKIFKGLRKLKKSTVKTNE
ncbi:MAG: glycoside hydrolase family 3 C-terminal domain-containing protein [Acholeplasmataceae bacterium]